MHLTLSGDNELKLVINLGSGPVALTHPTTIAPDGIWHNITVARNGRYITLILDDLSINSVSPGPSVELNVYDSLYIGGLPKTSATLVGFTGCLRDIRIGYELIESLGNTTEAVNINECF
ncbi:unnamed protein product [Gongylonema pulchrum]|uniref:Laminin G domain-containing protein n=1 Tax=Gongylonema pulchrum TaxID=637853 RepID=A0A3P7MP57_9BILA|nr:unnamed protein product [Gongylonema pulchrum]